MLLLGETVAGTGGYIIIVGLLGMGIGVMVVVVVIRGLGRG